VQKVAAELKSGAITPRQAVDRLMDLVIDKGAAAHLPEPVRAKIRAELEAMLHDDPYLKDKAGRLGLGGEPGGDGE
jgi:hypothetical protein